MTNNSKKNKQDNKLLDSVLLLMYNTKYLTSNKGIFPFTLFVIKITIPISNQIFPEKGVSRRETPQTRRRASNETFTSRGRSVHFKIVKFK